MTPEGIRNAKSSQAKSLILSPYLTEQTLKKNFAMNRIGLFCWNTA